MKWIGGAVLLIVTIILLIMAMFMFPWFKTKTEYNIDVINENSPEYWNQKADGIEHTWDDIQKLSSWQVLNILQSR